MNALVEQISVTLMQLVTTLLVVIYVSAQVATLAMDSIAQVSDYMTVYLNISNAGPSRSVELCNALSPFIY